MRDMINSNSIPKSNEEAGAWCTYAYDFGPFVISIHRDELEALRAAQKEGSWCKVMFWPIDSRFEDAVKMYEDARGLS